MSPINLSGLRIPYKAWLYSDKMWVFETKDVVNEYGATKKLSPDLTDRSKAYIRNESCRLSGDEKDTTKDYTPYNDPNNAMYKLFTSPGLSIKAGDYVIVDREINGRTYEGQVAEVFWYPSHIEVYLGARLGVKKYS